MSKAKCDAKTRSGGRCGRPAGWGTDHAGVGPCKLHGGMAPNVRKKWKRVIDEQQAKSALMSIDLSLFETDTDPADTMLRELNRCQRVVDFVAHQLENLRYDEIAGLMVTKVTEQNGVERTVTEHVWMRLYGDWSDRLVKIAKGVQELGLLERQVQVQEDQLAIVVHALELALAERNIAFDIDMVRSIEGHIAAIEAGGGR